MTLFLALLLDALFGEPKWLWSRLPHPAVLMGNLIGRATGMLNHAPHQKPKGVILCIGLTGLAGLIGLLLAQLGAGSRNFGYGDTLGAKIVDAACARRGTVAAAIACCRAQKRGHDCWT